MPKYFPKRRVVAVNGSAGAYVSISPTLPFLRKMEIVECPPGGGTFDNSSSPYNPQGLNYELSDDSFVSIYALIPGDTLRLGDDVPQGAGRGRALAGVAYTDPSGQSVAVPVLVKVKSATVTASQVEVREWV